MFAKLLVASTLVLSLAGVKPPDYSEKDLCDLWAGARCHATACMPDGQQRCVSESAQCVHSTGQAVPMDHAEKVAGCARALLKARCGDPMPAECEGVQGP